MHSKRILVVFAILGAIYNNLEFIVRALQNQSIHIWIPVAMFIIGGSAAFAVGLLNEIKWVQEHVNLFFQSLMSAVIILLFEFIGGVIVNIVLDLKVWDYSHMMFNILGQVCLLYGVYWLLIAPFAIWLDDQLRFYFCGTGKKYSLWVTYKAAAIPWAPVAAQQIMEHPHWLAWSIVEGKYITVNSGNIIEAWDKKPKWNSKYKVWEATTQDGYPTTYRSAPTPRLIENSKYAIYKRPSKWREK